MSASVPPSEAEDDGGLRRLLEATREVAVERFLDWLDLEGYEICDRRPGSELIYSGDNRWETLDRESLWMEFLNRRPPK